MNTDVDDEQEKAVTLEQYRQSYTNSQLEIKQSRNERDNAISNNSSHGSSKGSGPIKKSTSVTSLSNISSSKGSGSSKGMMNTQSSTSPLNPKTSSVNMLSVGDEQEKAVSLEQYRTSYANSQLEINQSRNERDTAISNNSSHGSETVKKSASVTSIYNVDSNKGSGSSKIIINTQSTTSSEGSGSMKGSSSHKGVSSAVHPLRKAEMVPEKKEECCIS